MKLHRKILSNVREFFHKEHHAPRIFGKISDSASQLIHKIKNSIGHQNKTSDSTSANVLTPDVPSEPAKTIQMERIREKTFEGVYDSQLKNVQNLYQKILEEVQPENQKLKQSIVAPEKLSFPEKLGLCDFNKKRMILDHLKNYKIEFQVLDMNFAKCSETFKEEHEKEMVQLAGPLTGLETNQKPPVKEDLPEFEEFTIAVDRAFLIVNEIKAELENQSEGLSVAAKTHITQLNFLDDQMKVVEQRYNVLPGWVKIDEEVFQDLNNIRQAVKKVKKSIFSS